MPEPGNHREPFDSLNKETGMLDGIEEVRELALTLSELAMRMLMSPAVLSLFSVPMLSDLRVFLILCDALLEPTTQYALFRRLGLLSGLQGVQIEQLADEFHLSHEYPTTHPIAQAAWEHVPDIQPDDAQSPVLRQLLREQQRWKREGGGKQEASAPLFGGVEDFLDSVLRAQNKEGEGHGSSEHS